MNMSSRARRITLAVVGALAATLVKAPTAAAYNADTHYTWTYYLALQVGFTKRQAYQIASAAFAIDHDPDTGPMEATATDAIYGARTAIDLPGPPRLVPIDRHPGLTGISVSSAQGSYTIKRAHAQIANIWTGFHAFAEENYTHDQALVERTRKARIAELWTLAKEQGNPGPLLHYVQDYYAHNAWDSVRGHAVAGHLPDYIEYDRIKGKRMTVATLEWLERFMREYVGRDPRPLDRPRIHRVFLAMAAANPLPSMVHNYQEVTLPLFWAVDRISTFPFSLEEIIKNAQAPTYVNAHPVLIAAIRKDQSDRRLPVWPREADGLFLAPERWYQYNFTADGRCKDAMYAVERPKLEVGKPQISLRKINADNFAIKLRLPYSIRGLADLRDHTGAPFLDPLPVLETRSVSDAREYQDRSEYTRGNGDYAVEVEIERGRTSLRRNNLLWAVEIQGYGLEPEERLIPILLDDESIESVIRAAMKSVDSRLTIQAIGPAEQPTAFLGDAGQLDAPGDVQAHVTVKVFSGTAPSLLDSRNSVPLAVAGADAAGISRSSSAPAPTEQNVLVQGGTAYPRTGVGARAICGNLQVDVSISSVAEEGVRPYSWERFGALSQAVLTHQLSVQPMVESRIRSLVGTLNSSGACKPGVSMARNEAVIKIVALDGDVQARPAGGTLAKSRPGNTLALGDQLITALESWARLEFQNGSTVYIAADSQVTVEALTEPQGRAVANQLAIKTGEVTVRIPERTPPPGFKVRTPDSLVGADGTVFTVAYRTPPGRTRVAVNEGKVRVTPRDPAHPPTTVAAGQSVAVGGAGAGETGGADAPDPFLDDEAPTVGEAVDPAAPSVARDGRDRGEDGSLDESRVPRVAATPAPSAAGGQRPSPPGAVTPRRAEGEPDPGQEPPDDERPVPRLPPDDPFRALPPPDARPRMTEGEEAQSITAAQILSGKWTSSTGKGYELKGGEFYTYGRLSMRVSCTPSPEKSASPIFDCTGDWFNDAGSFAGSYQGRLYLERGTRWYLEGKYNYASKPETWGGWNFARTDPRPLDLNSPPPVPANANANPITAAQILNGKWTSSTGKGYELKGGEFYTYGRLSMRVSCTPSPEKSASPIFDCTGDWFNDAGSFAGSYQGRLYLERGTRWYLEGKYNYASKPETWGGWNFGKNP